ncbi:MAG TPA: class I SAM-dependent methyltransferase [Nevskia sp.]|nr:class I SAM-dependent methyltransferase [Nevskia sp.]
MSGWGGGYVTDITYMTGYYRQQSPAMMTLACLLGGVASPMPGPDDPVSYLELGCGQGFGALVLAASNPHWKVTAIDFNPAHVAAARAWAAEAAIDNITFLEADLSTLAEDAGAAAVPEADFVSLHGVWSWVPSAVQAGIVRLLGRKVKPGGAVHVSYNSLPAWGAALGMQRILRDCGLRLAARSDRQAEEGLKVVKDLWAADAPQLIRSPWVNSLIERLANMPSQYLAHEYMNDSWAPCFHSDVSGAFARAKLEWVGSISLIENFPDLTFSADQRAVMQRFEDPLLRELVKDMCLDRSLRHDVFVRGARRMNPAMRDAALMDVSLALNISPDDMPFEADTPAGRASLNRAFYGPITAALAAGPRRVGDLLALPTLEGRRDNPAELIGILAGLELAEPALRSGAAPAEQALRFNRVTTENLIRTENLGRPVGAASYALGTGAPCTLFDLYVLGRTQDGQGEERIEDWIRHIGSNLDDEGRGNLRDVLTKSLHVRLPILHAQGVF